MQWITTRQGELYSALLFILAFSPGALWAQGADAEEGRTYANPLSIVSTEHGAVENCSDPEVLEGEEDDPYWYLYCTSNPLRADNRNENGDLGWHLLPMFRSPDLVNWDYMGDAFDYDLATPAPPPPAAADPSADLWAPEVQRIDGRYYLFMAITVTASGAEAEQDCKGGSSIGYAVSNAPLGPWWAADTPLIEPRRAAEDCKFLWTIDPEVIEDAEGQHHVFYGGASGGIEARDLIVAEDGSLRAPPSSAVPVSIGNRWSFEAAEIVNHDGYYYLFASATNCCNGPQTGYGVFVGRSETPKGPFADRQGASLLDENVGGTPVLAQNGNRWIGPGHNVVVRDKTGQWWTFYHAVDEGDPYFEGMTGFTKRPLLLDAVGWVDGWPVVNGGAGPSNGPQRAPALKPDLEDASVFRLDHADKPDPLIPSQSDEFDATTLSDQWTWLRRPAASIARLAEGRLRLQTRPGVPIEEDNGTAVLLQDAPAGDFVVETRVRLGPGGQECCPHGLQAGLVVQSDVNNSVKLALFRVQQTWQIEFARVVGPVPEGYPHYGNTVVGPPGEDWTWLRLAVRRQNGEELYTASTSRDGRLWVRGATWTHRLGEHARIGLLAGAMEDFFAEFDHVRIFALGS